jgi:polysaccharide biosynthesis protein PslA
VSLATDPSLTKSWQFFIKRLCDLFISLLALIILLPLIIYVAVRVYVSSPGPVIYGQERVGLGKRKFCIRKFRSMIPDAEVKDQPQLSIPDDPRITPWGRTMRRWKLDELPQLWNVLLGDMSIVGPRPEREFYIEQIEREMPEYRKLFTLRPGMTSYGMIRFGYAENTSQMMERARFDLEYLRNFSLSLDAKIIGETFSIIFKSRNR